jgi:hypothetical protein
MFNAFLSVPPPPETAYFGSVCVFQPKRLIKAKLREIITPVYVLSMFLRVIDLQEPTVYFSVCAGAFVLDLCFPSRASRLRGVDFSAENAYIPLHFYNNWS